MAFELGQHIQQKLAKAAKMKRREETAEPVEAVLGVPSASPRMLTLPFRKLEPERAGEGRAERAAAGSALPKVTFHG